MKFGSAINFHVSKLPENSVTLVVAEQCFVVVVVFSWCFTISVHKETTVLKQLLKAKQKISLAQITSISVPHMEI